MVNDERHTSIKQYSVDPLLDCLHIENIKVEEDLDNFESDKNESIFEATSSITRGKWKFLTKPCKVVLKSCDDILKIKKESDASSEMFNNQLEPVDNRIIPVKRKNARMNSSHKIALKKISQQKKSDFS